MRERPILFSAPMIRTILDGRKTQTRRVISPQPACLCRYEMNGAGTHALHLGPPMRPGEAMSFVPPTPTSRDHRLPCPYGVPGYRLWVRETWQAWRQTSVEYDDWEIETDADRMPGARIEYRATSDSTGPWRPSIFMPRSASRITLEVTEVRVQRLQEIGEDDAKAEGVEPYTPPHGHISPDQRVPGPGFERCRIGDQPHRLPFADLWDKINGKRASWASNPWVWCISFKRVP